MTKIVLNDGLYGATTLKAKDTTKDLSGGDRLQQKPAPPQKNQKKKIKILKKENNDY
ncbi:MAG: hypothetical protein JW812_03905 [Alphaproteobacteria bacterium]|nr:hypothetical protein [Alphaproteobacteria bacterium]MBN2780318.1 hypothetical protein [Alphaproteobacteria bacterium]